MKLKATAQYHTTPVSGKLTSNFIELSFGFQESGLGAEMFFNRSFEPTVPYRNEKTGREDDKENSIRIFRFIGFLPVPIKSKNISHRLHKKTGMTVSGNLTVRMWR